MPPKVALFSPLPPIPSGISDYVAELLPYLLGRISLTLVTDHYWPQLPPTLPPFQVAGPERFSRPDPEHLAVYQMGNNVCHEYMLRPMRQNPGIVVLHDTNLHGLLYHLTFLRGDREGYRRLLSAEHGAAGLAAASAVERGAPPPYQRLPLNGPCLATAVTAVVHSRHALEQLSGKYPGLPIEVIPMGVAQPDPSAREDVRARLGIAPGAFVVGSFGYLVPKKRVHIALQAFAAFLGENPGARYLLVGAGDPSYPGDWINRLGLAGHVIVTGFVPQSQFNDYLSAVDVCVNLRFPEDGETSATLIRALASAKPVLYTPAGSAAELPPGVGFPIKPDADETGSIVAAFRALLSNEALRTVVERNARHYYRTQHRPELSADRYLQLIERLGQRSAQPATMSIRRNRGVYNESWR